MAEKARVVVIKFNLDDPRDAMAYELLKSGGKKTVEGILKFYAKEKEEPIPKQIIVEGLDLEEFEGKMKDFLEENLEKFEKRLTKKIKSKTVIEEDDEEDTGDFKPSQALASVIKSINM